MRTENPVVLGKALSRRLQNEGMSKPVLAEMSRMTGLERQKMFVSLCRSLFDDNRPDLATASLAELENEQWNGHIYALAIKADRMQGNYQAALDTFNRCPDPDAHVYNAAAKSHIQMGAPQSALDLLETCTSPNVGTSNTIATAFNVQTRYEDALHALPDTHSRNMASHGCATISLNGLRKYGKTLEYVDRVPQKDTGLFNSSSTAFSGLKQPERALEAVQMSTSWDVSSHHCAARAHELMQDSDEALEVYERGMQQFPATSLRCMCARLLIANGDTTEAWRLLYQGIAQARPTFNYLYMLGQCASKNPQNTDTFRSILSYLDETQLPSIVRSQLDEVLREGQIDPYEAWMDNIVRSGFFKALGMRYITPVDETARSLAHAKTDAESHGQAT